MNGLRQIEQEVLALGREWTRVELEKRLQKECDEMPRGSATTGQALRRVRRRPMELDSVAGKVKLLAPRGYEPQTGQWISPAREAWGLADYERKTPELQARLTHTVTAVGSYVEAQALAATWGTPVSDGCIHQQVAKLGQKSQEIKLPTEAACAVEPPFSLVIMMDGWMARERGRDWGAGPRKKDPQRVDWREIKSAVIYRLEQRAQKASGRGMLLEKYVVATPPETSPVDFGQQVHQEALRRGLARAQFVYLVMDGAVWLWALAQDRFKDAIKTLDFHHAREHLNAVAEALYGPGTRQAQEWLKGLLHQLRHGKASVVVRRLEELLESKAKRSEPTNELIHREVNYFQEHRDHLHYRQMEKAGAPLGSGAVESLGKQLQRRHRGCGQFWGRPGLTHLLRLSVLVKNKDAPLLWN
ncbi:MAG: hypothetical protein IH623_16845 [Verrucomicrobia bacterium]|nr:hypothetical protein [Verrucomicrobiota bacterium]